MNVLTRLCLMFHLLLQKRDGLDCLSLASYKDNDTVEGFPWQSDRNTDDE